MKKRQLGNTDLYTAPIVFGGNVFGWTINEHESFDMLDQVLATGMNTIDTADVYSRWAEGNSGGESETIIGKWMKVRKNRDNVIIITKVGSDMGQGQKDLTEKYILKAVDDSLHRLQIDTIDLYLTHFDDEQTPVQETLGAYQKLIAAGKVRHIGASNMSPERLQESLNASARYNLPRYEVFQPGYNLYDRYDFEKGVADTCQDNGLGVISYFSLAKGFLTGKYRKEADLKKSVRGSMAKHYLDQKGMKILKALDEVADERGISQAGVALAWLIQSPFVTAPIASATDTAHLQAFSEAMNADLSEKEIRHLTEAGEKV